MSGLACGYCHVTFDDFPELKSHVAENHVGAFPAKTDVKTFTGVDFINIGASSQAWGVEIQAAKVTSVMAAVVATVTTVVAVVSAAAVAVAVKY